LSGPGKKEQAQTVRTGTEKKEKKKEKAKRRDAEYAEKNDTARSR
jgi:hypothetical protein